MAGRSGTKSGKKSAESKSALAPPEYVILWKLAFLKEGGSAKHARDILGILAARKDQLDLALIEESAKESGFPDLWDELLARSNAP